MDEPGFNESAFEGSRPEGSKVSEVEVVQSGEPPDASSNFAPDGARKSTPDAAIPDAEAPVAAAAKPRRVPLHLLEYLQFALVALVIALFVITYIVQAFRIPSGSMEDTLLVGDYLLVDKTRFGPGGHWQLILPYRAVGRGDIIVFRYPVDPSQHFVKRVIGIPGDRIHLWHSRVYVNGRVLHEPYVVFKEHDPDEFRDNFPGGNRVGNENVRAEWAARLRSLVQDGDLIVPRGQYFVLGDNRDQSLDSRYWGFVPRENIIGRPMVIYFSMVQAEDDDDAVASKAADDKLLTLRARISHVYGDLRWRRILRLVP